MNTDSTSQTQNTAGSAGQLQSGANNPFAVDAPPTISTTGFGTSSQTSTPLPQVSQTQDASQISSQMAGGSSGVVFPPAPSAPTNGVSANNSTAVTPSATDIINQGAQQTPADQTNASLLGQKAQAVLSKLGLTTLKVQNEAAAGVPGKLAAQTGLQNQLETLNNQSLDLQNQAAPGGAIQNQEQQDVLGRGVTAAGLAPLNAGDLRKNQIQQSALASRALTVKSLLYAAQNDYTNAKSAADDAAQAAFEAEQNQIDYMDALIAQNAPAMNKQDAAQAALVQAQLADRTQKINQGIEDAKTGQGLIAAAMSNNPNDPKVAYAVQEAAKLDKTDPNYLTNVMNLVGNYQKDPIAVQQQLATLASTRATTAKTLSDLNGGENSSTIQPYLKTAYDGSQYVDLSTLTPTDRAKYTQIAAQLGIKAVLTPADADKVGHIAVAKSNLNDIMNSFNSVPVTKDIPAAQGISNSISSFFGDPTIKAYQNYRTTAINTLQALAGGTGSGLRINQAEVNAAIKDIPVLVGAGADTPEQAQKKIDNLTAQLDKWQTQILGGGNTAAKDAATVHVKLSNGQTGTVNAADFDPKTMTKI